jgi:RecA-family ATPase
VVTGDQQPAPKLILTLNDWLKRDLPPPDFILGNWLTTTSRVLIFAPTGLGKTMFGIGIGMAISIGSGFLHWRETRPARVLFVDGEMSRRLLKERLAAEVARVGGVRPEGMNILSHEDIENFAPLNTPEGQAVIDAVIQRIGGVDLIHFDNVMSLIAGDQKDEEGWRQTLPWVRSLTKRNIGQIWVHHTGHNESHSYGSKIREWQMDTVIKLEQEVDEDRPRNADISFKLTFPKARERTPETRADFADVRIALVDDHWTCSAPGAAGKGKVSPSRNWEA